MVNYVPALSHDPRTTNSPATKSTPKIALLCRASSRHHHDAAFCRRGERFAVFLWIFALWDIGYYVELWATVRWPYSPTSPDVLFFIPVAWTSQVWFPILISILTVAVVLLTRH